MREQISSWLGRFTIGQRLGASFLLVILVLLGVGGVGLWSLASFSRGVATTTAVSRVAEDVARLARQTREIVASDKPIPADQIHQAIERLEGSLAKAALVQDGMALSALGDELAAAARALIEIETRSWKEAPQREAASARFAELVNAFYEVERAAFEASEVRAGQAIEKAEAFKHLARVAREMIERNHQAAGIVHKLRSTGETAAGLQLQHAINRLLISAEQARGLASDEVTRKVVSSIVKDLKTYRVTIDQLVAAVADHKQAMAKMAEVQGQLAAVTSEFIDAGEKLGTLLAEEAGNQAGPGTSTSPLVLDIAQALRGLDAARLAEHQLVATADVAHEEVLASVVERVLVAAQTIESRIGRRAGTEQAGAMLRAAQLYHGSLSDLLQAVGVRRTVEERLAALHETTSDAGKMISDRVRVIANEQVRKANEAMVASNAARAELAAYRTIAGLVSNIRLDRTAAHALAKDINRAGPSDPARWRSGIDTLQAKLQASIEELAGHAAAFNLEEVATIAAGLQAALADYAGALDRLAALASDRAAAGTRLSTSQRIFQEEIGGLVENQRAVMASIYDHARLGIAIGTVVALAICALLALALHLSLVWPIGTIAQCFEKVQGGQLDVDVYGLDRRDEFSSLASAVEQFRRRSETIHTLEQKLEQRVMAVVQELAGESALLTASSGSMVGSMTQATVTMDEVSVNSQESAQNAETVAAAGEELAVTVEQVSEQIDLSRQITLEAASRIEGTKTTVRDLVAAARRVGEVTNLIRDIAEQTNLLALNATIEAARAGTAGRGFAVVAAEVKGLAVQTATATRDIEAQIASMTQSTDATADAVGDFAGVIGRLTEIASSVASAAEQQSDATHEILQNVRQVSAGARHVQSRGEGLAEMVRATKDSARTVEQAAIDLESQTKELGDTVAAFLSDVKAA